MNRNLPLLVPKGQPEPDAAAWATVTQVSPLRIKIDGESAALPFTPTTLVAGLVVNDRVWVALATNADPSVRSRRVVVIGRSGGALPRMGCNLRRTTIQSQASGAASTAITWLTEIEDTHGLFTSGDTITIPTGGSGIWAITFMTQWSGSLGTGRAFLTILTPTITYRVSNYGSGETFSTMSITVPLAAAESFNARVFQTSGGSLDVIDARLHCYRVGV